MRPEIELMQSKIMALSIVSVVVKGIAWIAVMFIIILGLFHIEDHGLKHLIDTIWLGPTPS